MDILSRPDALEQQSKYYFSGKFCVNGHRAPRYTTNRQCIECTEANSKAAAFKATIAPMSEEEIRHIRSAIEERKNPLLRARKRLFNSVKHRAAISGIEFSLTIDDIVVPESCPVLGTRFKFDHWDLRPSVDRIDNNKGYIPSNIHVISYRANRLKSDASLDELQALADYFVKLNNAS